MAKYLIFFLLNVIILTSYSQEAKEIVKKAYDLMKGESSESQITMKIIRPSWERSISMKSWSLGTDYSMVLITAPAKEKGQVFLKRQNDMWNWVPGISRMIKLPPSMMSQGWMGSDFSNDEMIKEASIIIDYNHEIIGSETVQAKDCYKIKLSPKPNAPVVWGHIEMYISKKEFFQLKTQYFDEDGELVKTEIASQFKTLDSKEIPTMFELIPEDNKGNKTIMTIENIKFNAGLKETFFSQQNMKVVK